MSERSESKRIYLDELDFENPAARVLLRTAFVFEDVLTRAKKLSSEESLEVLKTMQTAIRTLEDHTNTMTEMVIGRTIQSYQKETKGE